MPRLTLHLLPGEFAVCRLSPSAAIPAWGNGAGFCSVTKTDDELSLICPAAPVPADVRAERGWRLLKVAGPLDLSSVGILASITAPLAAAGVSILAVGTFDTDYVLVRADTLHETAKILATAGHTVTRE